MFQALIHFLCSLRWKICANASTAYVELAVLFLRRQGVLESIPPATVTLLKKLRKACTLVFAGASQKLLPGKHDATWAHKCGHALPKGARVSMTTCDL